MLNEGRGGIAVRPDQIDDRRSYDDAVGNATDRGGLLRRTNAETYGDGQVGRGLQLLDGHIDIGLRCLLLAGDPRHRHMVEEAAGTL